MSMYCTRFLYLSLMVYLQCAKQFTRQQTSSVVLGIYYTTNVRTKAEYKDLPHYYSPVTYLLQDCMCRKKVAGYHRLVHVGIVKSAKMVFSVSPPIQSTSPFHQSSLVIVDGRPPVRQLFSALFFGLLQATIAWLCRVTCRQTTVYCYTFLDCQLAHITS